MGHPAKKFKKKLKKFFAGCLTAWHPAKADGRWPPSSRPPLPAVIFCRVAGTRQRLIFADGWNLPSARLPAKVDLPEAFLCRVSRGLAPGKEFLCRVPDKKHPANIFAPGKSAVSCSDARSVIFSGCLSDYSNSGLHVLYTITHVSMHNHRRLSFVGIIKILLEIQAHGKLLIRAFFRQ